MNKVLTLLRKPLGDSVARTTLKHGTGGLNIDAGRVEGQRWPSNVILQHTRECSQHEDDTWYCSGNCPTRALDSQSDSSTKDSGGVSRYFKQLNGTSDSDTSSDDG